MAKTFSNKKIVTIHAPVTDIWQALTDPEMIKHYFFGVETAGKWNEGNTIVYKGEWQGKKFEAKGKVLQMETQKLLRHSYWSNMSGLADMPQNYHIITYQLTPENGSTKLTLTEENLATKEMKESSARLWDMVFDNLKKLLEKRAVIQNS
jgi:uncharacterized protein YndB with AHSA1/START domain